MRNFVEKLAVEQGITNRFETNGGQGGALRSLWCLDGYRGTIDNALPCPVRVVHVRNVPSCQLHRFAVCLNGRCCGLEAIEYTGHGVAELVKVLAESVVLRPRN